MAAVLMVLIAPACGPIFGDKSVPVENVKAETVEAVVSFLLENITTCHEEFGPMFTTKLPELKKAAARREEFEDWDAFKRGLRATDPSLEVVVANRITMHMDTLLAGDEDR